MHEALPLRAHLTDLLGARLTRATTAAIARTLTRARTGQVYGATLQGLVVADSIFDTEQPWSRYLPPDECWCNFRDLVPADAWPPEEQVVLVSYQITPVGGDPLRLTYRVRLLPSGAG